MRNWGALWAIVGALILAPAAAFAQGGNVNNTLAVWGVNTSTGAPCIIAPVGASGTPTCWLPNQTPEGAVRPSRPRPTSTRRLAANTISVLDRDPPHGSHRGNTAVTTLVSLSVESNAARYLDDGTRRPRLGAPLAVVSAVAAYGSHGR